MFGVHTVLRAGNQYAVISVTKRAGHAARAKTFCFIVSTWRVDPALALETISLV